MEKNAFVSAVTENGNEMYGTPIAEGDVMVFTDIREHSVNGGNPFQALFTADEQFISANAFLRLGNGIQYQTPGDREKCAGELYDKVMGVTIGTGRNRRTEGGGLKVTILKRWKTPSSSLTDASGNPIMVNNYRFKEG